MPRSSASAEDELVREALDGLFEIANEDQPAAFQASLRAQIDEMPAHQCRRLVEQMVDTDRLQDLVEEQGRGQPSRPPSAPDEHAEKVDEALEPLVAWTMGEEGRQALQGMEDSERLHVLFSSLGPR